ncbi:MAG: hypothetical protein IAF02_02075 [Anaerolineae bacterium]|nr:hypothetical protein [Anaerolineae bacterium]
MSKQIAEQVDAKSEKKGVWETETAVLTSPVRDITKWYCWHNSHTFHLHPNITAL